MERNVVIYLASHLLLKTIREYLYSQGFIEIMPVILTVDQEPLTSHAIVQFHEPDAYPCSAFLPNSMMEKEYAMQWVEKAFCFAPCVRVSQDEIDSKKHIPVFTQVEIELKTSHLQDVTGLLISLLQYVGRSLSQTKGGIFVLERVHTLMEESYTYFEYADLSRDSGCLFSKEDELILSLKQKQPFLVQNYPLTARNSVFNLRADGYLETFDLFLPFGYGEIATGGIRPADYTQIEKQLSEFDDFRPTTLRHYRQWKSEHHIVSAGFGIGFERLLQYLLKKDSIKEIVSPHLQGHKPWQGQNK